MIYSCLFPSSFIIIRAHRLPCYNLAAYALLVFLLCVSFRYNLCSWFALVTIYASYGLNSFAMIHVAGPCFPLPWFIPNHVTLCLLIQSICTEGSCLLLPYFILNQATLCLLIQSIHNVGPYFLLPWFTSNHATLCPFDPLHAASSSFLLPWFISNHVTL